MISSMSFLVLPWSSQFLLHLFWTTHLQGMSLRRTGVWCGHASSSTLIGIQETLSFIVFLWVYIGSSQRCDRKNSYVIEHFLWAYFSQISSREFCKHQEAYVLMWEQVFPWRPITWTCSLSLFGFFFCLIPKSILCFGRKANLCTSRNSVMIFEYKVKFFGNFSMICVHLFHVITKQNKCLKPSEPSVWYLDNETAENGPKTKFMWEDVVNMNWFSLHA
jgi:hypothetical protein